MKTKIYLKAISVILTLALILQSIPIVVSAEATIGIFPTDDGGKQFDARYNVSAGWFGWGYVVRVKAPA